MRRGRVGLRAATPPVATLPGIEPAGRGNKFGAKITTGVDPCGGTRRYASKREARRAAELHGMKARGEIADFFPQASLAFGVDEAGNAARYIADFLVIAEYHDDGTFTAWFEDPKGFSTERSSAKIAALRARGLQVRTL
jgi:hypothetical protein